MAEFAEDNAVVIANAGLVLVNAYLVPFFERLGVLRTDGNKSQRFVDPQSAARAARMSQFLVYELCNATERELLLNKIMCGLSPNDPIEAAVEPDAQTVDMCEDLLEAIISRWPRIGSTTIASLRTTFLQRTGSLNETESAWRLRVERKSMDVLVDSIPWSFSIIHHPWMIKPIHVMW